ncbi:MAG: hypothetical protein IJW49_02370 [Clostridia bacterium]|nr:hypothetical protein [Clostridia bacterium]
MKLCIVYPARSHSAYRIAAETFAALAEQVAGVSSRLLTDKDFTSTDEVTVLIGNDAVNAVTAELYLEMKTEALGIRYGTDDYCIRHTVCEGKSYLILAGGRPRSAIYAVYRYFERFCGCRWFWDGDRIPQSELVLSGIDLVESPRFDYRGLRYFAHRSLHRFQAEQWSFEDWMAEIDWVLKKRLNLFMLRIGMDDIFQKAFPDIVSYPDQNKRLPGAGDGYNDRTLFWSLEYRGELRKKILQYAFERDLMHPEDCGTMSHWYSRTPVEFLEKVNPDLLPQSNNAYNDPTGRVWDIRNQENFDNYFKLTEAHIREYGKAEIFHTIGLGERLYSADPEKNRRMKLYVYHKIATRVKEQYPNAPLLIASWDLWMHFTPEEVQELVADLDPAQAILFDYTSDTVRENNFTNWGVVNKFPWIFGIFSGYEPNSEIRGYYELTNERLKLAKDDPMCKGLVLWPELSHGDPFVIDYFAHNAWERETLPISEQVDRYCLDRYPAEQVERMQKIWQDFMPIVELAAWSVDKGSYYQTANDIFPHIFRNAKFEKKKTDLYRTKLANAAKNKDAAAEILRRLSEMTSTDSMMQRDLYDIARTVIGRYINALITRAEYLYVEKCAYDELTRTMENAEELLGILGEVLGSHEDYSLLSSLNHMHAVAKTNPNFEQTLKENASSRYCRSYISENLQYLYLPEMKLLFEEVRAAACEGREIDKQALDGEQEAIRQRYFDTPLADMKETEVPYSEATARAAALIGSLELW